MGRSVRLWALVSSKRQEHVIERRPSYPEVPAVRLDPLVLELAASGNEQRCPAVGRDRDQALIAVHMWPAVADLGEDRAG